jgi:hypothetical protein
MSVSRDISVSEIIVRFSTGSREFLFAAIPKSALGLIQPLKQWNFYCGDK